MSIKKHFLTCLLLVGCDDQTEKPPFELSHPKFVAGSEPLTHANPAPRIEIVFNKREVPPNAQIEVLCKVGVPDKNSLPDKLYVRLTDSKGKIFGSTRPKAQEEKDGKFIFVGSLIAPKKPGTYFLRGIALNTLVKAVQGKPPENSIRETQSEKIEVVVK